MRIRSVLSHSGQAVLEGALIAALVVGLMAGTALAGKGGGGKPGGGGSTTGGGTIAVAVIVDQNSNGAPNWNDNIRFNVSTTSTTQPRVDLACYQGAMVYFQQTGYWDGYLWPWTQTMNLSSGAWTSGGADCTATLYKLTNSGSRTNLATLSFRAGA